MAASNVIRELLVSLGYIVDKKSKSEAKDFEKSLSKLKSSANDAVQAFQAAGQKLASIGRMFAYAGAAAGIYNGLLIANSVSVANNAKQVERQSRLLGLSTDAYQELRGVLAAYGVDAKDLTDIFAQMVQKSMEAQQGSAASVKSFKALGISVKELKGLNPEQLFTRIAKGFNSVTDDNARIDALSKILGEEAFKQAGPLLAEGSEALAKFREEFARLGGVLSTEDLQTAKEFNLTWTGLKLRLQAITTQIGVYFMPILNKAIKRITDWMDTNRKIIRDGLENWIRRVGYAYDFIAERLEAVDKVVQEKLGGWSNFLDNVAIAIGVVAAAFMAFQVGGAISLGLIGVAASLVAIESLLAILGVELLPLILAVSAAVAIFALFVIEVVAVVAALEDMYAYFSGKDSLIGRFIDKFKTADGVFGAWARTVQSVFQAVKDLYGVFAFLYKKVSDFIVATPILGKIFNAVIGSMYEFFMGKIRVMTAALEFFIGLIGGGARGVSTVAGWITGGPQAEPTMDSTGLYGESISDPVVSGLQSSVSNSTNVGGNTFNNNFTTSVSAKDIVKVLSEQTSTAIQNLPGSR